LAEPGRAATLAGVDLSEPPALEGVEHRYVEVRGARMHVADSGGDGPPVVLLHGWPQHWYTWRGVIERLRDDFRVVAIDLRGFGWSEATPRGYRKEELAQDVVGVLDALGLERVFLVGHDWGGVVGFIVCVEHPERVIRYVPMNTGHIWPKGGLGVLKALPGFAYQGLLASPGIGHRVGASPRVLRTISKAISTQSDAVMADVERFAPRFAEPARARAAQQVYRTFLLHDYPSWVRGRFRDQRLSTPTLWLNGEQDPVLKRGSVEDIAAHADDVSFEYLPDCGHFPPQERPDLVAAKLRELFGPPAD
jgi:pimeloyl-ACP methyl ester carboxylesterase